MKQKISEKFQKNFRKISEPLLKIINKFFSWIFFLNHENKSRKAPIKYQNRYMVGNQSINQWTDRSVNQTINRTSNQWIGQSINQAINRWAALISCTFTNSGLRESFVDGVVHVFQSNWTIHCIIPSSIYFSVSTCNGECNFGVTRWDNL
jgi:hypothetical protein